MQFAAVKIGRTSGTILAYLSSCSRMSQCPQDHSHSDKLAYTHELPHLTHAWTPDPTLGISVDWVTQQLSAKVTCSDRNFVRPLLCNLAFEWRKQQRLWKQVSNHSYLHNSDLRSWSQFCLRVGKWTTVCLCFKSPMRTSLRALLT